MILPEPSIEQAEIVKLSADHNLVVDSVAGSGKTTTILHIGRSYPDSRYLVLTYNKRLKFETRDKIKKLGLTNMEAHSYHSFCVRYYDKSCHTDHEIRKIWARKPLRVFSFDRLIIDEAQDMTPTYFQLVCKICRDNLNPIERICIIGDRYQSIFEFNLADERFIIHAEKIFGMNKTSWRRVNLHTSFRITRQMAQFINQAVLANSDRLQAVKDGPKPVYIVSDCFEQDWPEQNMIWKEVRELFRSYTNNDFFILAPSIRSEMAPVRILANICSKNGIPIHVPSSDEEKLDEDVIRDKVVFSTFHQVKGLERKVVVVFCFDDSYFKYYIKNKDTNVCTNDIYVALTRGIERLIVCHHYDNNYIDFLNREQLDTLCTLKRFAMVNVSKKKSLQSTTVKVTDLTRHLPAAVVEEAMESIDCQTVVEPQEKILIPIKIKQDKLFENVSEITGVAIPSHYELETTGDMSIRRALGIKRKNPISPAELLELANRYCAMRTGYQYKLRQIRTYDWLDQDKLDRATERLRCLITDRAVFEKELIISGEPELMGRQIIGYIDCIDGKEVYEFKCTDKIDREHILQTAIYQYMLEIHHIRESEKYRESRELARIVLESEMDKILAGDQVFLDVGTGEITDGITVDSHNLPHVLELLESNQEIPEQFQSYYVLNILTGQRVKISSDLPRLRRMMRCLIENKYGTNKKIADEQFIQRMKLMVRGQSVSGSVKSLFSK